MSVRAAWGAVALTALLGCGGSTQTETPGGHKDASVSRDGGRDAPATGTNLGPCGAGGACPSGASCYFAIGSCSTQGECIEDAPPGTGTCKALEQVCGCGTPQTTGCGYPSGYASGPALGPGDCTMPSSSTAASSGASSASSRSASTSLSSTTSTGGGGILAGCPTAPPKVGDACEPASFPCEYGSDPDVRCDTLFECKTGHWALTQSPATTGCGTASGASCPASYAALSGPPTDGRCSVATVGTTCDYPQARCGCSQTCGMVGVSDGAIWCCPDAPATSDPGCPSPRPRLGGNCQTSATVCDYGGCSGNVMEQCGPMDVWVKVTMFGCPG